jgi:hypothetical protein
MGAFSDASQLPFKRFRSQVLRSGRLVWRRVRFLVRWISLGPTDFSFSLRGPYLL